jgi:hypothetical protein
LSALSSQCAQTFAPPRDAYGEPRAAYAELERHHDTAVELADMMFVAIQPDRPRHERRL